MIWHALFIFSWNQQRDGKASCSSKYHIAEVYVRQDQIDGRVADVEQCYHRSVYLSKSKVNSCPFKIYSRYFRWQFIKALILLLTHCHKIDHKPMLFFILLIFTHSYCIYSTINKLPAFIPESIGFVCCWKGSTNGHTILLFSWECYNLVSRYFIKSSLNSKYQFRLMDHLISLM